MNNTASGQGINNPRVKTALELMGKMFNIASIYGTKHPSFKTPLEETFRAFAEALRSESRVVLGVFNKTLTVNDRMVTDYTVHLRALERKLVALDTPHLIFELGLTKDELHQIAGILTLNLNQSEQALKKSIDEADLEHIKAEIIEYVAQHEGERIVGEDEGIGRGEGGTDKNGLGGDKDSETEANVHVEQIMAFLKGDLSAKKTASKDMQEMLSDPEKLGQLIMESVEVRQTAQALDGGESLADIVIGCLRKTYDGLSEQKKYRSARGKASLNKAMLLLEKTVVDKIRNSVGEEQPEVDDQILEALREAEEQRQVEILAARYAEQRKKITKAELDLLEYIREHGEEKARALLDSSEVSEPEWDRLVIRARQTGKGAGAGSGPGPGAGPGGNAGAGQGSGDHVDMGALAIVLDKLEDIMGLDNVPPEIIGSAVGEVRDTAKEVRSQVENEISKIEEQIVQHETECRENPADPANQKNRGDILLEISQLALKLAQPLTVISASIDGAMDPGSGFQKDLLDMAQEAAETMKGLMDRLTKLVGFPSMQEADQNINLYD